MCRMCKNVLLLSDRTYQCFGQWEEDGLLYTYTRRRDVPNVYECFVGGSSMAASDRLGASPNSSIQRKISIIESGFNCKRGLNVNDYGMPLTKKRKFTNFLIETIVMRENIILKKAYNIVPNLLPFRQLLWSKVRG